MIKTSHMGNSGWFLSFCGQEKRTGLENVKPARM